ncbi:MAG: DmsC/YnfH family molybdoenzyme membrane anchor subunit, partial [Alphaproteobacteria bacterium]
MNPAYSVIFFTTASGTGSGLLALLGLFAAAGRLPADPWLGVVGLGLALLLVTGGLLSSTFHLGHPERAWRGLTQWRSSWLSREGIVAVVTYLPAGLFGIGWVFFGETGGVWALCGLIAALLSAVTVACTAMIYASLKTVPRWNNQLVLPVYLAMALSGGAVVLTLLVALFGSGPTWSGWLAAAALVVAWTVKSAYWVSIDNALPRATAESATGLGDIGKVRLFEPPHTGTNYLLQEMGYKVARKHAAKLRRLAVLIGGVAPLVL